MVLTIIILIILAFPAIGIIGNLLDNARFKAKCAQEEATTKVLMANPVTIKIANEVCLLVSKKIKENGNKLRRDCHYPNCHVTIQRTGVSVSLDWEASYERARTYFFRFSDYGMGELDNGISQCMRDALQQYVKKYCSSNYPQKEIRIERDGFSGFEVLTSAYIEAFVKKPNLKSWL